MLDERVRFDDHLTKLEDSLRSGDDAESRAHLAAFDAELTRCMRGEERVLFPELERRAPSPFLPTVRMRHEHASLRRLTRELEDAIERSDLRSSLDTLATLWSVLLLHGVKEEQVLDSVLATRKGIASAMKVLT